MTVPFPIFGLSFIVFIIGVLLLPAILYNLTLQRALERCAIECRTLSPGLVWLLLLPLFNIIWHFVVVGNISRSLRNEFNRRNFPDIEAEPGKGIGLAMCILDVGVFIPFLGIGAAIAGFVCWILYWVKIHEYSEKLCIPLLAASAPWGYRPYPG